MPLDLPSKRPCDGKQNCDSESWQIVLLSLVKVRVVLSEKVPPTFLLKQRMTPPPEVCGNVCKRFVARLLTFAATRLLVSVKCWSLEEDHDAKKERSNRWRFLR